MKRVSFNDFDPFRANHNAVIEANLAFAFSRGGRYPLLPGHPCSPGRTKIQPVSNSQCLTTEL